MDGGRAVKWVFDWLDGCGALVALASGHPITSLRVGVRVLRIEKSFREISIQVERVERWRHDQKM
jgi:hypothetical protein